MPAFMVTFVITGLAVLIGAYLVMAVTDIEPTARQSMCESATYLAEQHEKAMKACRADTQCLLDASDFQAAEFLEESRASACYVDQ